MFFSHVVVLWFLQGIFAKTVFLLWCFCGEFVVECVANVVEKPRVFVVQKMGLAFEVYFCLGILSRPQAASVTEKPRLIEWMA
jgi:hypothetical protein